MNFKKFSTSDNQWHDAPYYQHKTATDTLTLPAVIYPNDTSITVGIKGQSSQSGTPTPDSPITPQGTGERTGNLAPPLADWISGYVDANGNIHKPSGTVQEKTSDYLSIEPDTDYVFAFETGTFPTGASGYWSTVGLYDENKAFIRRDAGSQPGTPRVFHTDSDAAYIRLSYRSYGSTLNTMLNSGSEALPYEPYGYKIPISSANTTTPVYLGEVQTTRAIKKLVLTGEEDYAVPKISLRVPIGIYAPAIPYAHLSVICSHFQTKAASEDTQKDSHLYTTRISYTGGIIWFFVPRDFFSGDLNVDNCEIEYKEWLAQQYAAGTPVTVWYVLATPETEVINEPLMKIGDYADILTTSIPVTAGENTLDVQTTVQPSEVTANYQGWHPVTNVHVYPDSW